MSGGVDSSVAAALLVEQGYDVIGVTMRVVPDDAATSVFQPCCSLAGAQDARKVAESLGIPHEVAYYVDCFEREVIGDFIREYQAGHTPNPCVRCNQWIKFGALFERADALGAEYVATGHHVRLVQRRGRLALRRAVHRPKDQSYVLACLTQDQLARALFPLGNMAKDRTRERARDLGLTTADKPESQEICFIPDDDYRGFLAERLGTLEPGPILSTQGEVLGRHQGLACYTVGQRKGLGIAAPRPYYVLRLDVAQNALIVGPEEATYSQVLSADQVNWCAMPPQTDPFECWAKIRYRHGPAPATVVPTENGLEIRFHKPQQSVTPGQWAVLYDDEDYVLAAGVIEASR